MQFLSPRTLAVILTAPAFIACASFQQEQPVDEVELDPDTTEYIDADEDFLEPDADFVEPDEDLIEPDEEIAFVDDDEDLAFDDGDRDFTYIDDRTDEPWRHFAIYGGARDFSDDAIFGRVDDEIVFGLEYAQEIDNDLGFEVGALGSLSTEGGVGGDVDVTGAAVEIYGGARYIVPIEDSRWRPYVGAGLAGIFAGVDNDAGGQVADDQDFSFGLYAHGGVLYDWTDTISLGLDLRGLFATDLDLETVSGDADYIQLALVVAFRL